MTTRPRTIPLATSGTRLIANRKEAARLPLQIGIAVFVYDGTVITGQVALRSISAVR